MQVDHNAIKFTQTAIVITIALAWVLATSWLVLLLGLVLLIGVISPDAGPLRLLYRRVAVGLGAIRPHLVADEAAPHRFSQGLGSAVLVLSAGALYAGLPGAGWLLAGLVAVLAAVNVLWNFCAGCFIYYQLRRAGILRRPEAA